jgi:hypothetical protein
MRQNSSDRNRNVMNRVMQVVGMAFGLVYVLAGSFVMYYKWLMIPLNNIGAYSLGILLIVYGIFRGYRAYTNLRDLIE